MVIMIGNTFPHGILLCCLVFVLGLLYIVIRKGWKRFKNINSVFPPSEYDKHSKIRNLAIEKIDKMEGKELKYIFCPNCMKA